MSYLIFIFLFFFEICLLLCFCPLAYSKWQQVKSVYKNGNLKKIIDVLNMNVITTELIFDQKRYWLRNLIKGTTINQYLNLNIATEAGFDPSIIFGAENNFNFTDIRNLKKEGGKLISWCVFLPKICFHENTMCCDRILQNCVALFSLFTPNILSQARKNTKIQLFL